MNEEDFYKEWELQMIDDYGQEYSCPNSLKKKGFELAKDNGFIEQINLIEEFSFQTVPGINFVFKRVGGRT